MPLESLLKPVGWTDEQVLRQYTKLTKKWEAKGRSRYALSNWVNIPCLMFNLANGVDDTFISAFQGHNLGSDTVTKPYGEDFTVSSTKAKKNNLPVFVDRLTRLPLLVTGMGLTGFGLYEVITGFYNKDNQTLSEGITKIKHGVPFLGVASSQYIKDADPKLLEKEPFWQKVYSWAKEKVSSLAPQPLPQPAEANNYSTLDDYVGARI